EEKREERVALFLGQFENARGKTGIDEKPSSQILDCAHDRMNDWRINGDCLFPLLFARADSPASARKSGLETVLSRKSIEKIANRGRERLIGCDIRAPQCVAATRRRMRGVRT